MLISVLAISRGACAQEADPVETLAVPVAERSITLKDSFKKQFQIGTAVNRSITTGIAFRRGPEDVGTDIQNVKRHFNQIVVENDMKWQMIHPRPGADGYDFGPADAFVEFGISNDMSLAGHTLVWHSQTPNWVFSNSTYRAS